MKAKKIRENIDNTSGSNSIWISQTYKLLGDVKCGIKKGNSGNLERLFASLCGLFGVGIYHGISPISFINLFPDPLGVILVLARIMINL